MIKTLVAAVAALFISTGVVAAQTCFPVENVLEGLEKNGIEEDRIEVVKGTDFTQKYHVEIGIRIPAASNPVGMLFVYHPQSVRIAIIEQQECIRFHMIIERQRHQEAYDVAIRST